MLGGALALVLLCCGDDGLPAGPSDSGPFPADIGPTDTGPAPDTGPEIINGCPALRTPIMEDLEGDTYETFARTMWFETYCYRCHHTMNTTAATRNGAPMGYNWDDPVSIQEHLAEIRNATGVVNYMPFQMPPGPNPTCEERRRFIRWIDGGAPGLAEAVMMAGM